MWSVSKEHVLHLYVLFTLPEYLAAQIIEQDSIALSATLTYSKTMPSSSSKGLTTKHKR